MDRDISPTALLNALTGLKNHRHEHQESAHHDFHEVVGGSQQWTGTFTFELIERDTGAVSRRVETNTTVNEGENALLQFLGGIPDNQTVTFSGDGSTTEFTIPYPYKPVQTVNSVSVGGTTQTILSDYALNYYDGTLYFDTAPADGTDNIAVDVDYITHPWEWLAVGTDGSDVDKSQTSLLAEDTRIPLDNGQFTRNESAVEITGQWTFSDSQANISIAEAGLFNAPDTVSGGGDMLNRTVVSPNIEKSSSQDLLTTWTLGMV